MDKQWSKTLPAGGKWSAVIGKGKLIQLTALGEGANLSMLLYNARDLTERYNMSDTLKAQHTSHLSKGHVLMSDNGFAMASLVEDELGWHDPISGYTTRQQTDMKYGVTTYQELRNDWLRSGQENFAVELVRNGLGARDLVPVVNLFSKVSCDANGDMRFSAGHCAAGVSVTLRTEMDVLLLLSNTPHPLDPAAVYPSVPIAINIRAASPLEADDCCLNFRPENRRAFENTWDYYVLST